MMNKVILFDGTCHFCSRSVQFILKRDTQAIFQFASRQSAVGQTYLQNFNIPRETDSLVLIENNQYFLESTAALKICQHLKGLWKLCGVFRIVPPPIRNVVYR